MDGPLTLAEELLLLTGYTGDQPWAWQVHFGVAGALLAELQLAGRLGFSADGRVTATNGVTTRDGELDAVLAEIAGDRVRKLHYWVGELVSIERTGRLAGRLARRRVDHHARRAELRSRVSGVLEDPPGGDDRTEILAAIVHACRMTALIFPGVDHSELARRRAELSRRQPVEAAVRHAIRQAQRRAWLPNWQSFIGPPG